MMTNTCGFNLISATILKVSQVGCMGGPSSVYISDHIIMYCRVIAQ